MKLIKTYGVVLILFFILLSGFWLRSVNYTTWPRHGATFDEFAWTWLGINLIQKKEPISWSPHPQYTHREHLIYQKAAFWIVRPYLEHPPLFGLIAGSFALLNGAKDMYHVKLENIRPLALILGTLAIGALFVLAQELYGKKAAVIASILYATIPTIVIGSRIVQNENFLIPMWLFLLYLSAVYIKNNNTLLLFTIAIISGLLLLAKIPWLVAGFSVCLLLAYHQKWKDAVIVGLVMLAIGSTFIIYGFYFDKELFLSLWKLQLARYDISFVGFFSFFTHPLIVDRLYLDGWIYFGFFSLFLLARNVKQNIFILLPFLSYFFVYIFFIPDEPFHGWYRFPFYPFFIVSIALFLKEYFINNQILTTLFLSIVGMSLFQLTWIQTFGFSYIVYRLVLFGFAFPLISIFIKDKKLIRITTILNYSWFSFFVVLNIWAVMIYNEQ